MLDFFNYNERQLQPASFLLASSNYYLQSTHTQKYQSKILTPIFPLIYLQFKSMEDLWQTQVMMKKNDSHVSKYVLDLWALAISWTKEIFYIGCECSQTDCVYVRTYNTRGQWLQIHPDIPHVCKYIRTIHGDVHPLAGTL